MSPVSLAGHEPTVQEAIARLITRLDRAAASGQAIDMLMYLNDMATDSIGFAAFGIDLHCQELTPERAVTLKRALTRSSTLTRSNSLRLSLPRAFSLTGSMRRDNVASPRQISDSAESPRSRNCVRLVSQDSVRVKPLGLPPVKEPEVLEDWMKRPGSRDFGHGLAVTLRTIMNEFMPPQGSVAKLVVRPCCRTNPGRYPMHAHTTRHTARCQVAGQLLSCTDTCMPGVYGACPCKL